jgi:hypothetical protein
MTLKLNGTNSEAAPAYAGDDADTGLQCGTNELKLVTGGSARATVDSDGDLGIGTASPSALLHIAKSGGNAKLLIQRSNTAANTNDYGSILWQSSAGNNNALIGAARHSAENDAYMFFSTASGGSLQEELRIQSAGGISFNGDTAQANALDDYEEGAWTAGLSCAGSNSGSVTFTSNTGSYIKIGRLCFISIFLQWSASTLSGTGLQLTGLPFTQQGNASRRGGFQITYRVNALTGLSNVHDLTLRTELNNTLARFQYGSGDGNAGAEPNGGDIKNAGASMMITGTYETA